MQLSALRLLWIVWCTFHWSRFFYGIKLIFVLDSGIKQFRLSSNREKDKMSKMKREFCAVLLVLIVLVPTFSQDVYELTSSLDDPRLRFLFHSFRDIVFNTIGRTGRKTKGRFLQEKFPDNAQFPCDVKTGKSKVRPSSIHKLRPGGNDNLFRPDAFIFFLHFIQTCLWDKFPSVVLARTA